MNKEEAFKVAVNFISNVYKNQLDDIHVVATILRMQGEKDYSSCIKYLEDINCFINDLINNLKNENN